MYKNISTEHKTHLDRWVVNKLLFGYFLLVFRFFERKTLLDHWPKPHDPVFYGFCGFCSWKPQFLIKWVGLRSKTTVFGLGSSHIWKLHWKLWFSAENCTKNHSFWLKTMVFGLGSSYFWKPHWKPWFLAKNCGFWLGSSHFWKPQFLVLKTTVFGQKLRFLTRLLPQLKTTLKTVVFGWKPQFSVWFSIVGGAKV